MKNGDEHVTHGLDAGETQATAKAIEPAYRLLAEARTRPCLEAQRRIAHAKPSPSWLIEMDDPHVLKTPKAVHAMLDIHMPALL
jgi:hypothetical protein